MAVMGELLHRNCNAAVPHVDIGTDVFAFRDDREEVARIQVKTARGKPYKDGKGYAADFRIPMGQLHRVDAPALFYVLAVRLDSGWGSFLVISRDELRDLSTEDCGTKVLNRKTRQFDLRLYVKFRRDEEGRRCNRRPRSMIPEPDRRVGRTSASSRSLPR